MSDQNQLEQYKGKGIMLMPTTNITQATPWHKLSVTEVKISSNPEDGEVFNQGQKGVSVQGQNGWYTAYVDQFSLGKVALMKIAQAAGITWDYAQCGPLNVTRDYILYKAVGMIRLPAGNWQVIPATKEIDLSVIEDELMDQNMKKYTKLLNHKKEEERKKVAGFTQERWAELQTKAALIQWRKHKTARAETGAMERVIRAALSMKQTYTAEELAKPFIVPRIDFSPDYSDPNVQRMMMENGVRAMSALFGSSAALPSFSQPNIITVAPEDDEEVITIDGEEPSYFSEADEGPVTPSVEPEPPAEKLEQPSEVGPEDCEGDGCNAKNLGQRVIDYSVQRYGKRLCYACQKKQ